MMWLIWANFQMRPPRQKRSFGILKASKLLKLFAKAK